MIGEINYDTSTSITGILGGILCAIADCVLDLKGADNHKIGKYIESNWENMSSKRFLWSTILGTFACDHVYLWVRSLMMVLYRSYQTLALVLGGIFMFGIMGAIMIHSMICLAPTIYKIIAPKSPVDDINEVLNGVMMQISVPFVTGYLAGLIIPSIAVMVIIVQGILPLPLWCVLLNPFVFQIIGILLRKTKCKLFVDFPGICAASLGIGMYGVLALMLL